MHNDVKLAARVTANNIHIRQLKDELTAERARVDQLAAHLADLQRRLGRLERIHEQRTATISRLRARLQDARRSRDLWRYRYGRDVV